MKKQILISAIILFFLFAATTLVILYGRGYRFWFDNAGNPDISGTGLLVTTSDPDGAQVFVDGHLTTATDSTINLAPGTYSIKIFKEGYFPWEKKINIQKEVVAKAEALLFATTPKLDSLTTIGVENPILSPSLSEIAYTVASQSARKNGIYVLNMNTRLLTLQSASEQIADDTADSFSKAHVTWSPDGREILASVSAGLRTKSTYLLLASSVNNSPKDITTTLESTINTWEKDTAEKEKSRLETLKIALQKVIIDDFSVISWSPDETKILYTASASATIPNIINPSLIGTNQTLEERNLTKDAVYVYDIKEDKNFRIEIGNLKLPASPRGEGIGNSEGQQPLRWYPDSAHLIYVKNKKINILEYDGTNMTTVYAGPFIYNYVFPYPSGSKIVILTDLGNPDIAPNLYTVGLK